VGKKTTGLVLTFAALAAAATIATPASAEPVPQPGGWIKSQEYQSHHLCQSAGLVGEFFGLWRESEWKCVDSTLYVLQGVPVNPAG
jgi:hypothetical protein